MKTIRSLCVWLGLLALGTGSLAAVPLEVEGEGELTFSSGYAWRGDLSDAACAIPSVRVSAAGVAVSVVGILDLKDTTNSVLRNRMEFRVQYSYTNGIHIVTPGITAYVYDDSSLELEQEDTFEFYMLYKANLRFPKAEWYALVPTARLYYDFSQIQGYYASVGVKNGMEIKKETVGIELCLDLGAGDDKYVTAKFFGSDADSEKAKGGLIDFSTSLGVPIAAGNNMEITPEVKVMCLLDSDIRDVREAAGQDTTLVTYGARFTAYF